MFLENSRYHKVKSVDAKAKDGRTVKAVKLRILPPETGSDHMVSELDRLDILAHRSFRDPTASWRIADANTELERTKLTTEPGRKIIVPEK
jgi:hypothetical protein